MNKIVCNRSITSEKIYHEYKDQLRRYIQRRINHPQDAEDLLSCVFLKIHEHLHTYDSGKASLSTWIYTITHNTVNDYLRKQYHSPIFDTEEDALVDYAEDDLPVLDKIIQKEQLESLGAALEYLPEREREIIILRFYYQYTSPQIAAMMGLSHENVRYLQHIAIGKLKKKMVIEK
jgi:RNA polymerase sigma factor, sigma-70 family